MLAYKFIISNIFFPEAQYLVFLRMDIFASTSALHLIGINSFLQYSGCPDVDKTRGQQTHHSKLINITEVRS